MTDHEARPAATERIVTPMRDAEELQYEAGLRPRTLADYVGQERVRENLAVSIEATRQRREALDHVLLYGPPGLGKTTLAYIIAQELEVQIRTTSGPVLERPGDLAALLTNLKAHEVLFIDEIHRMSPVIEEILYPALEDYELDIVIGQGPSARSVKVPLQPFTLIGATTRAGLLTSPLRTRFGIVHRLDFYTEDDLREIVTRSALILHVPVDAAAAGELARRGRGTPRVVNRLLRRVRDYAEVRADGAVDTAVAKQALELLGVDDNGFDEADRRLLRPSSTSSAAGRSVSTALRRRSARKRKRSKISTSRSSSRPGSSTARLAVGLRPSARTAISACRGPTEAPGSGSSEGTDARDERTRGKIARRRAAERHADCCARHVCSAPSADQRRPREAGRHLGQVDSAAHRDSRAAHRRRRCRHLRSREGSGAARHRRGGTDARRHRGHCGRHDHAGYVLSQHGVSGPEQDRRVPRLGFDVGAACSGFAYALTVGAQLVATGAHDHALVIGADVMSSIIDYKDRQTCVLFGDGAGAVVISPEVEPGVGLLDFVHEVDGSGGPALQMPAGGSRNPATHETVEKRMHYVHQDGATVFKFAVRKMEDVCRQVLERNGLGPETSTCSWRTRPTSASFSARPTGSGSTAPGL